MSLLSVVDVATGSPTTPQIQSQPPGFVSNVWPVGVDANIGPNQQTGHYMIMRVNTQKQTQYQTAPVTGEVPTTATGSSPLSSVGNTQRTTEAFTIFIPDGVVFSSRQTYDDFDIGGTGLAAAITAAGSFQEYLRNYRSNGSGANSPRNLSASLLSSIAGVVANKTGYGKLWTAATGLAFNPFMEVIYMKPEFRTFKFDYLLFPRTAQEAEALKVFIRRLRYHSAPENKGFFLIPPSTFDIEFMFGGTANPFVEKIYTCVLESIDVDYTATGIWSTYVDGSPIGTRLSLSFKEMVYLTKEDYKD